MKCKECGKDYSGLNGLSVHVSKSHDISKAEYCTRHTDTDPKCACGCGQRATFVSIGEGFKDYVRGHHPGWNARKTKKTSEKLRKVGEKISEARSGQELGRRVEWVEYECGSENCSKTIERPPSRVSSKKYCSKSCRKDAFEQQKPDFVECECEKCGRAFKNGRNPCGKIQEQKYCSSECAQKARAEAAAKLNKKLPSQTPATEKAVMDWLDGKGFEFRHQAVVGQYVVDFLLPNVGRVVECYGDYWHCHPDDFAADDVNPTTGKKAKNVWRRDRERKCELENEGYEVTILWESEIKNVR